MVGLEVGVVVVVVVAPNHLVALCCGVVEKNREEYVVVGWAIWAWLRKDLNMVAWGWNLSWLYMMFGWCRWSCCRCGLENGLKKE